jgi:hypothetical protein
MREIQDLADLRGSLQLLQSPHELRQSSSVETLDLDASFGAWPAQVTPHGSRHCGLAKVAGVFGPKPIPEDGGGLLGGKVPVGARFEPFGDWH